ncbi:MULTISPECIES: methionyl-tRNA formyltransferase [unclassified Microbacterium]|uniref:methionyl-tRNA formyltransferase n=1 Tax=unclassified Microbacterium TaxID=2609290 RepID=UPI000CFDFC17|nr:MULTISPECIES: methionyl-tRNA formyltransferase [unclassified Microbacterium]PQZ61028.1 methionyl-tRNA formyltransferase [Microbacterium sp. MYb43]PQZ82237.1 methionyl-tRNA formyltransferase [Microbacterium sp. MYb40]PRB24061.1 methionyl-tRNA formyltransferase [Microbacterium sp. MYb54]PRB30892.1 methionyl-tRNA formyltransferase [Microbacterium sp. MYb50]PRB70685.1 methionyl-tRNA formyltransferase [Microbacterium sp. MYb24]
MRLVFAGTPSAAVPTLRLLAASHDIAAVVTRPDAPLGRRRVLTPSPVAQAAVELGLPVIKTARLDDAATADISALQVELGVIVAYGGLVREPLLSAPTAGWINLHFSLLPAWRGAAPVQRALIAGDEVLGASVFQLVAELDAGDVFAKREVDVVATATAGEALEALAVDGAELTADVVSAIADGTAKAVPQRGTPTFAAKLTLADGLLDWNQSLDAVFARFRGVTPEPGAHTTVGGQPLKVLEAVPAPDAEPLAPGRFRGTKTALQIGTATGALAVSRLQPAGKGAMNAVDWWRGQRGGEELQAGS